MTALVKKQNSFELTLHSLERIQDRFYNLTKQQIQDAFQRSKMLNIQNSLKYGKTYQKRVYGKTMNEPTQKLLVNPYYDITFVIDEAINKVLTVYSFSKGNE